MTLLNAASRLALRGGLYVQRANSMTMWAMRMPKLLEQHGVTTVLDIGANDGGYASDLLDGGFKGKIVSFEPLPEAWDALSRRAARRSPRWKVAPRVALSDEDGEARFHRAANSTSSSLLEMADSHLAAAPHSRTVDSLVVKTARLDDIIGRLELTPPFFMKIDVQGAELMVLEGARKTLGDAVIGLQVETSLQSLYEGQASKSDLERVIGDLGFQCWEIIPGFRDPNTLRLLQYDAVYFKDLAYA